MYQYWIFSGWRNERSVQSIRVFHSSNVRHLILVDDWLYLSINGAGYVQRVKLDSLLNAARSIQNHGTANLRGCPRTAYRP